LALYGQTTGANDYMLWGAQLTKGSELLDYTATTTAAVAATLEYVPVGLSVYEARTNLCLQSEDFGTTWTHSSDTTSTTNYAVAPDGTSTADRIIDDGGATGSINVSSLQELSLSTSTKYTASVFLKADQLGWARLWMRNFGSLDASIFVDLNRGVIGPTVGADTDDKGIEYAGNGWYRCWLTFTTDGSDGAGFIYIYAADSDNDLGVLDDGTSSILHWGAQVEKLGAPPSPYLKTTTAAVAATADGVVMTGTNFTSWFNQSEGTFFIEYTPSQITATSGRTSTIISVSDNSISNQIWLDNSNDDIRLAVYNGSYQANMSISDVLVSDTSAKTAVVYSVNDFHIAHDGALTGSPDTSGAVPTGFTDLDIGSRWNDVYSLNGNIARITYWPHRLSDIALQNLTI
jgi:hypothetical protein